MNGVSHKKYQTHLTKEFENQQQPKHRTKKKHNVTNNMKTDEGNNKHNQPYPSSKEKNVSKIVSTQMAKKHSLNREYEMRKIRLIPFLDDFEKK